MMIVFFAFLAFQAGPETATQAGSWRRIAAPPKLERFGSGEEQTVDFTIFPAKDGTWQLISCVRKTSHPGGGRLLYRWEGKSLEDADWAPQGIFRTSDPALGHLDGVLQAPHAVEEDGVVWLFYSSGGARALTSRDGKTFEPARSASGDLKFFDMPRDVMLLDRRSKGGGWIAFFTDIVPGQYPERKNHTVSYRTAPKLAGPWSGEKTDIGVATPPPPGYVFMYAESPFLLERKGWYYRFEQLNVYASRELRAWTGPPVASLAGKNASEFLSPELIEHGGKTYLAAYKDHGKAGIFLTTLSWK